MKWEWRLMEQGGNRKQQQSKGKEKAGARIGTTVICRGINEM